MGVKWKKEIKRKFLYHLKKIWPFQAMTRRNPFSSASVAWESPILIGSWEINRNSWDQSFGSVSTLDVILGGEEGRGDFFSFGDLGLEFLGDLPSKLLERSVPDFRGLIGGELGGDFPDPPRERWGILRCKELFLLRDFDGCSEASSLGLAGDTGLGSLDLPDFECVRVGVRPVPSVSITEREGERVFTASEGGSIVPKMHDLGFRTDLPEKKTKNARYSRNPSLKKKKDC